MTIANIQKSPTVLHQEQEQQAKLVPVQLTTWQKVCQVFLYVVDCLRACFYGREVAFYNACKNGHIYTVQQWINRVDLEKHGSTYLYAAARASQVVILNLFMSKEVDANAPFVDALVNKSRFEICKNLLPFLSLKELQAIDEVLKKDYDSSIIGKIALRCHRPHARELIEALMEKGFSSDPAFIELLRTDVDKPWLRFNTLYKFLNIFVASSCDFFQAVDSIRIKLPGNDISMPLLSAAICLGNDEAVCSLNGFGAFKATLNVDEKDSIGRTPLMNACNKGRIEAINFLLQQGADIRAQDNDGKTAFMLLEEPLCPHNSIHENEERLVSLIESFASTIDIRDKDGKTAFFYLAKDPRMVSSMVFLSHLDIFTDKKTRENFVLEALTFDDLNDLCWVTRKLISKGCGVVDDQLSPAVQQAIESLKTQKKDPDFSKNIDKSVESGLETFQKTQQKEEKSDE